MKGAIEVYKDFAKKDRFSLFRSPPPRRAPKNLIFLATPLLERRDRNHSITTTYLVLFEKIYTKRRGKNRPVPFLSLHSSEGALYQKRLWLELTRHYAELNSYFEWQTATTSSQYSIGKDLLTYVIYSLLIDELPFRKLLIMLQEETLT